MQIGTIDVYKRQSHDRMEHGEIGEHRYHAIMRGMKQLIEFHETGKLHWTDVYKRQIRDITLGQYYPADSILHKLDPRVKLVTTIVFLIALFVADDWVGYLVATVFLVAVIKLSKRCV